MHELLILCLEFFKTGLFAVGGGLATLPFLMTIQQTYGWFSAEELANMIAVSESTPGPIGVNMATYVGFAHGGVVSALTATLSLVFPSVVIICLIAGVMEKFQQNRLVQDAFAVIRPAVTGLIAAAGMSVVKLSLLDEAGFQLTGNWMDYFRWECILLAAVLLVCTRYVPKVKNLHPICFILASAVIGVVFRFGGA